MREVGWFLIIALVAGFVFWFWHWRARQIERERAAEERMASFMTQALAERAVPVASAPAPPDPAQRLLFEAAGKAGEAGEPVLAIQLYARLLSRFPDTPFAAQARAAVDAQKKKLAKA